MIQIEPFKMIPENFVDSLAEYSAEEVHTGEGFLDLVLSSSEAAWIVREDGKILMAAGIVRESFVARPFLWFLLGKDFHRFHLRKCRQMMQVLLERYPEVEVAVEDSWRRGEKFALFCGFRRTEVQKDVMGKRFSIYVGRA